MPNGRPGDHPITDILIHGLRVYSRAADALIREIVQLGGRDEISDMLLFQYNQYARPNTRELKRVLTGIRDRLRREAKEHGNNRAAALVATLGLLPHPEGGYYGELYRSDTAVHPADGRGSRAALTTIYFLLPAGAVSRWHRVNSDEVWHFYEGAALDIWMAPPEGYSVDRKRLGPLDDGQRPVWTVPARWWQAARSTGAYTLVGCTVGPGFDFGDFALAADHPSAATALRSHHPELAELL
jgi:predicted cupin superfamily sugar epimerase